MRQVVLYPGEDGYWVAECPGLPGCASQGETRQGAIANIKEASGRECPGLPGCASQGETRQGAIANIKEAIEGYINVLEEDGLPAPEERFETLVVAV